MPIDLALPPKRPAIILPRKWDLIRPDRPKFRIAHPWAAAMMGGLGVNALCGGGGSASLPPPSFSYRTRTSSDSDTNSYSFAGVDIGTAAADRIVFVCVGARNNAATFTISGVTIAGNAAASLVNHVSATQHVRAAIYGLLVPAGTTATIIVTTSVSILACGISVYAAYGLSSATPSSTNTGAQNSSSAALACNLTIPAGGFGIAYVGAYDSSSTFTWAGLTENDDAIIGDGVFSVSAASGSTPGSPLSISADPSATPAAMAIVGAAWP